MSQDNGYYRVVVNYDMAQGSNRRGVISDSTVLIVHIRLFGRPLQLHFSSAARVIIEFAQYYNYSIILF